MRGAIDVCMRPDQRGIKVVNVIVVDANRGAVSEFETIKEGPPAV
jgi:hypothetical protein